MTQTLNYREVKAVSNSVLTEFENDFRAFRNWWLYNKPFDVKDSTSLTIGAIVDTLRTREKDFGNLYIIAKSEAPSPQMVKFCENLLESVYPFEWKGDSEEEYREAYKLTKFGREKYETVKKNFLEICTPFYKELDLAKRSNKILISKINYDKAKQMSDLLKTNEFTKDIMLAKTEMGVDSTPDVEVFNQLEIYSEYTETEGGCNIPVKGALDRVVVDHIHKVIKPYDLKTSVKLNNFIESYEEYRYFRQASYYTWLLSKWVKEKGWEDYTIEPFVFVVVSNIGEGAYTYKTSEKDMRIAEFGGWTRRGEYYPGWRELLDDICWHVKNNKWQYPRKVYENKGVVKLELFI